MGSTSAGQLHIERISGAPAEVLKEPHLRDVGRRLSALLEPAR